MKAILAFIMAILTALLGLFGLGAAATKPAEVVGLSNGEWLQLLVESFDMDAQTYDNTPYYAAIPATDAFFKYVQICYEWGVVTDTDVFKTGDPLQLSFLAVTAVRMAKLDGNGVSIAALTGIANADEIAIAISNGIIALQNGKWADGIASLKDAAEGVKAALAAWRTKGFADASLDVVLKQYAADLSAQGLFDAEIPTEDTELKATDVFEEVSFAGNFAPDLRASSITNAKGEVLNDGVAGDDDSALVQQGILDDFSLADLKDFDLKALLAKVDWKALLKKINFSFDVPLGDQKIGVNVAVVDDGFRASLSGLVFDGVRFSKSWELSNFAVAANMDADLLKGKISEAYVRLNYDLIDTTAITGGYSGSLTDVAPAEGEAPKDVMERLKAGLIKMAKGTGGTVNLFTAVIPIPNLPALTVTITFSLTITVDGQITLRIASKELKGFEIINNNARFLNQSTVLSEELFANANAEAKANVTVDLSLLGFCLVDVGVSAGIGATASVNMKLDGGVSTYVFDNLPAGLVFDSKIPSSFDNMTWSGSVTVYFILEIYYGSKSVILNLIPQQYRFFKILGRSGSIAGDAASVIYQGTFGMDGSENRVFGNVV